MNEVKITELSELESANVSNTDVLPIVDVSADETKKIKVQNIKTVVNNEYSTSTTETYSANYINNLPSGEGGGIIALKSITTAPSTFSEGDKYYNANDDLIYTATSSSTWDEGTEASAVSLYLNEIDNKLYRYYNNTMNLLESGSGGAGETLPVGSEIDFDGNASDIPSGWEQVSGVNYTAYELYANATGSNTNLTLSDSAANYVYLEIFYKSNDNVFNSTKVYEPNGKTFLAMGLRPTGSTTASPVYLKAEEFSINGTTITKGNYVEMNFQTNGTFTIATNNVMYITRVVGLKEE